ncbi:MAG: calcium-binding protein [Tateyamaria sp.]
MPTAYTEQPVVTPDGIDGSFEIGTIDLAVGDTFTGTVGDQINPTKTDTSDNVLFNMTAGVTYVFTVNLPDNGETFFFSANGTTTSGTYFSRLGNTSDTELSLSFTAGATELAIWSISGTGSYTITVSSITLPYPTEGDDNLTGNMTADRVDLLGGNDTYVALGGSDVVVGGDGNDSIDGVCGNDTIDGDDGNDTLIGGNGRDVLNGGNDDDLLDGGNQEDALIGGMGNDTLIGDKGEDTIAGGDGDDDIDGGQDNDEMSGGAGSDTYRFRNGHGQDTITDFTQGEDVIDLTVLNISELSQLGIQDLGSGVRINTGNGNYIELTGLSASDLTTDDFLLVEVPEVVPTDGADTFRGTSSADLFLAGDGADHLRGEGGRDTLDGGTGRDTILGGDGADSITGGSGSDDLRGGAGGDTILGGSDNDKLMGEAGRDYLNGENANDRLYGGGGHDTLIGENGNDLLHGGGGNDSLSGGAGKDRLEGRNGNDTLEGGFGDDILIGGTGADVFVFADDQTRADTITDFTIGTDLIQIGFYGFTDISDLNMVQDGADVLITLSVRDSITIENTLVGDLSNSDFDFV